MLTVDYGKAPTILIIEPHCLLFGLYMQAYGPTWRDSSSDADIEYWMARFRGFVAAYHVVVTLPLPRKARIGSDVSEAVIGSR